ncbi:MAG TPA: flagella basal body P-ring formation protein FlgA [Spirochaetota bacterium]|nr:flagella basal body P-ring formation protein FlgA [Spirochaetota bacterium]HOS40351.1 flagella basal body P-ring formation protein FlgA [Spirochaetota bacterium]HPU88830.1 flagella basal body P-ring formation protein FlgA [Spirochaetota bacterium]
MLRAALIVAFLITALGVAAAEVRLLLYPTAQRGDAPLALSDVARVEAGAATDAIGAILIPGELCRDGLLDRTEIAALVARLTNDLVFIEGNAVRIVRPNGARDEAPAGPARDVGIKAGERITVVVRKNGVAIELPGVALGDGRAGETVSVRLKGAARLTGRIVEGGRVEVTL